MPVVINELVFKAEIASTVPSRTGPPDADQRRPIAEKEIIAACVEEVMRILDRKKER